MERHLFIHKTLFYWIGLRENRHHKACAALFWQEHAASWDILWWGWMDCKSKFSSSWYWYVLDHYCFWHQTWKGLEDPILHIELRRWADIMVLAPLDANTLGKIACGLCDNLLVGSNTWIIRPVYHQCIIYAKLWINSAGHF